MPSGFLFKRKGFSADGDWTIDVMGFDRPHNVAVFTALSSFSAANDYSGSTMLSAAYSGILRYDTNHGPVDFSDVRTMPAFVDNGVSEITFGYGAEKEDGDTAVAQADAIFFVLYTDVA
jgi:hypothetical protein